MRGRLGILLSALMVALLASAALGRAALRGSDDRALYTPNELAAILRHSPLPPPPPDPTDRFADNLRAAALGQALFFDAHLSPSGTISCATCHQPERAFTDGRALAKGLSVGTRHSPTLLGAAYNQWYFWDGRTDSQWSQALQPFENPREFGSSRAFVVRAVAADKGLRAAYVRIFGTDIENSMPNRRAVDRSYSNLGKAIEAYERRLIVGTSPFDHYVAALKARNPAGEAVLSAAAKRGLKLFVGRANCELCHAGPDFTDRQFHNIGLPLLAREAPDAGRAAGIRLVRADPFNGAGAFSDAPRGDAQDRLSFLPPAASQLGAFKTPSLRNVVRTGPYMHDGRFASLEQVLDFYSAGKAASHGWLVGKREATTDLIPHLSLAQRSDLTAFLRTLSDAPLPRTLTQAPAPFVGAIDGHTVP